MNKVSLENLKIDSYIDQPVFLDEKYILLSPDISISGEMIQRLKKWDFTEVKTNGIPFEGNSIGNNSNGASETVESHEQETEEQKIINDFTKGCVAFLTRYYDNFRELDTLPLAPISEKAKEIIFQLKEHKDLLLNINSEVSESESYIIHHSIKTTFLVLAIADFLKFPIHKQIEIGIAAMLHKLGMLLLPSKLYEKQVALTDKELQVIRTHPVISYKTLKQAEFPVSIYIAILEHHEHMNGSGYPRKLTGDKISLNGKILSVASAFAAATTKRPYRSGLDGHSGIMDLLKSKGTKYDENILRTLVYIMSLYPIGTYVKLSNSTIALVIKTNLTTPKHPILKLLMDEKEIPYTNKPILQTRPEDDIQITGTLKKEEIEILKAKLNLH
ncbi:MAG: HD domain-containing protein [Spirochaetia bacterium]|jgi:HD-GYP domain-containing protein (c-di-GMP phosphodiesterase class II)|nr:HD domain-containing protein [Spirochaetia bacterium]